METIASPLISTPPIIYPSDNLISTLPMIYGSRSFKYAKAICSKGKGNLGKRGIIIKAKKSDKEDEKEFPSWVMAPKEMEYFAEFLKNYNAIKDLNAYFTTFVSVFKFILLLHKGYTWLLKKAAVLPSAETQPKALLSAKTEIEPQNGVVGPNKEGVEPGAEPKIEGEPKTETAEPKTSHVTNEKRKTMKGRNPKKGRTPKEKKTVKQTPLSEDDEEEKAKDKKDNDFLDRRTLIMQVQLLLHVHLHVNDA